MKNLKEILQDTKEANLKEAISVSDLEDNRKGTAHGGAQVFSTVKGKSYSWNYVKVKNGKYDVVVGKEEAEAIVYNSLSMKKPKVLKLK